MEQPTPLVDRVLVPQYTSYNGLCDMLCDVISKIALDKIGFHVFLTAPPDLLRARIDHVLEHEPDMSKNVVQLLLIFRAMTFDKPVRSLYFPFA